MDNGNSRSKRGRVIGSGLTGVVALVVAVAALAPLVSSASSHREAPLTAADPQVDATDLYAFVSPDDPDTVTFVRAVAPSTRLYAWSAELARAWPERVIRGGT